MSRYIDADMLEKDRWNIQRVRMKSQAEIVFEAKKPTDFPAADVVEVVRCKDCKWLEKWHKELPLYDTGLYCTRPNQQSVNLLPTDYCSYGERKDG